MSGYDIAALAAAVVTATAAGWSAWWSPAARRRRVALEQQLQFHRDWNGSAERRGMAGEQIADAQPGVMERLASLEASAQATAAKLSAPILNGRGNQLLDTVDRLDKVTGRLDRRSQRHGRRLTAVERQLADGFAGGAKRVDRLDQRLESRFAEQTAAIADVMTSE